MTKWCCPYLDQRGEICQLIGMCDTEQQVDEYFKSRPLIKGKRGMKIKPNEKNPVLIEESAA